MGERTCSAGGRLRMSIAFLALAAWRATAYSPSAYAEEVYQFVDEAGVIHITDSPGDPRFRPLLHLPRGTSRLEGKNKTATHARRNQFVQMIHDAASQARVDPWLIQAVVLVESGFDPNARSPRGAQGLMQLMPATSQRYGIADPFDPRQNLHAGATYLRELITRFDSLPLALAAYNAGEATVARYGNSIPPFAETTAYVPLVLGHYDRLRNRASVTEPGPRIPPRTPK